MARYLNISAAISISNGLLTFKLFPMLQCILGSPSQVVIINKGAPAGAEQSTSSLQCLSHPDCFRYLYLQFRLTVSEHQGQAGQHYSSQTAKGGNTLKLFILVSSGPTVIPVQSILKSCSVCFCIFDVMNLLLNKPIL